MKTHTTYYSIIPCTISLIIVFLFSLSVSAGIKVEIKPTPMIVGEPAELHIINTDNSSAPKLLSFPKIKGLKWLTKTPSTSMQTQMINFHTYVRIDSVYIIQAEKEGKISFPKLKIRVGKNKLIIRPFKIRAVKRQISIKRKSGHSVKTTLDQLLFLKVVYPKNNKTCFVGQEIPLHIQLYALHGLDLAQIVWPEIEAENIVFKNYSAQNPKNPKFAGYTKDTVKIKGEVFDVYTFVTAFRPIASGELKGKAWVECIVKIPRTRTRRRRQTSFLDPFFDDNDFFSFDPFSSAYRDVKISVKANFPVLNVKPVPTPPKNSFFLGLTGKWNVDIRFSSDDLKVGEPVSLILNITGFGSLEPLKAPKISIDGFRIYPPETDKKQSKYMHKERATIKYVLIPLKQGKNNIDLRFSTFFPDKGEFNIFKFTKTVKVKQGDTNVSSHSVYVDAGNKNQNTYIHTRRNKKESKISEIFYLKKESHGGIYLPLWKNYIGLYLFLLISSPLLLLISELIHYRRRILANNPLLARKYAAYGKKAAIIKRLKNSKDDECLNVIRKEVIPFINDVLGMPPGTSASELADKINNPSLSEYLRHIDYASYMPDSGKNSESSEIKKQFLKFLKTLTLIFIPLLVIISVITPKQLNAQIVDKIISSPTEAMSAYDNGDFKAAATFYSRKISANHPDPNMLYNLGNCLYQEGNLSGALICYERARRLKPWDSQIVENMNLVRRNLGLEEYGNIENPIDLLIYIRDSLRPDLWMIGVCLSWFLIFIILIIRRKLGKHALIATILSLVFAAVICLSAYITQMHSTYSGNQAIITTNNTPVYSLPSLKNGKVIINLHSGDEVTIVEERNRWYRIRSRKSEGWIKADSAAKLWKFQT